MWIAIVVVGFGAPGVVFSLALGPASDAIRRWGASRGGST
jgi:hypothetical protein